MKDMWRLKNHSSDISHFTHGSYSLVSAGGMTVYGWIIDMEYSVEVAAFTKLLLFLARVNKQRLLIIMWENEWEE